MLESLALKLFRRKPSLMLILVATLVALVALLATLQYRWLGQVSQGERERMQASLRTGATRFGQDFNREITRAFINFQLDKTSLTEKAGAAYAERFANWASSAPYPRLVSELFLVELNKQGALSLSRFNREASAFETRDWPAEFAKLRERFEREHLSYTAKPNTEIEIELAPIAEEIPALVIPVMPIPPFQSPEKEKVFEEVAHPLFPGYTILKLDLDYITQEFIPALARAHFSGGDGLDYNLAVISRSDPGRVIYRSDQNLSGEALNSGDATANIFDLRLDQFDLLVLERNVRSTALPQAAGRRPFRGFRVARIPPPRPLQDEKEGEIKDRRSRSVTFRYHNSIREDQSGVAPGSALKMACV